MVGLAVLGLAFVFFVVVAFFAAKTWHVGHVVALVFLFLGTLLFLFLTATLFRTHQKFRPAYQQSVAELTRLEESNRRLQYGAGGAEADADSVAGLQSLVRVEQFDRGRIWRNLRRVPGDGILLSTAFWRNDGCLLVGKEPEADEMIEPVPDEDLAVDGDEAAPADAAAAEPAVAAGPAGPVNAHGIQENQFLYAFKEYPIARFLTSAEKEFYFDSLEGDTNYADQDTRGACRVPMAYLGQFRVAQSAEQTITLVPEGPLDPAQIQRMNDPRDPGSWVLYEHLPLDRNAFTEVPGEKLAGLLPLQRLNQMGIQLSQRTYDALLNDLLRDGQEVDERNTPPDRVEVEVEFLRPHTIVVDFEVEGDLPETDQPFTPDGRAQVKLLMQGEPSKFAVGQVARFDLVTAQGLINQGLAKRVKAVYRRQLRDFEFTLQDASTRIAVLRDETELARKDRDMLQAAIARLQDQIVQRREEIELLNSDLGGFDFEQQQLRKFASELQGDLNELQRVIKSAGLPGRPTLATPLAAQ